MSVYGSYSVSYLPSSGDQFSSLTVITQQVEPEQFTNYEVGAKWDARPALSLTTAVYRLDRTNTRATDPNDPTRIVQTGSQRTNGYELGINGAITPVWKIAGGYAYQNAFVTSATAAARAGAVVGQVPHNTFSLWNNYQVHPRVGVGLGVLYRSDMFATIDNTVVLPAYTRADAAAFVRLSRERAAAAERRESLRRDVLHQRRQQHEHLVRVPPGGAGGRDDDVLKLRRAPAQRSLLMVRSIWRSSTGAPATLMNATITPALGLFGGMMTSCPCTACSRSSTSKATCATVLTRSGTGASSQYRIHWMPKGLL